MNKLVYDVFHYLHVLGAVFAIGPYAVFFHVLRLMKQMENGGSVSPANLSVLRFVVRVSKHAGHVLVVSGVLLWWLGGYALWTSWIVIPVAILLAGLYFMARAFSPILEGLEKGTLDWSKGIQKLRFSLWGYLVILLVSLWFMITKPVLW
nr:hypothetical protein [Bacillota bacterium]